MFRLGKVRIEIVKRVARELVSRFPDAFTTNYYDNKRKVAEFIDVESKRLRNRIAGYITSIKRIEERRSTSEAAAEGARSLPSTI
ncbi:MAG: 30S ribosomal protein S17e [Candidatus Bathyarchaeia archaeon]